MKIVIIGSGNLATVLSKSIIDSGHTIIQVISRNEKSAANLATKVNSISSTTIKGIILDADIYILAVPDRNIISVAEELPKVNGIVVHTSGGTSINILKNVKASGHGVLYPFQTFTKTREININEVPIIIEANSRETLTLINGFANTLSNKVLVLDSETRSWVHLAGVFTNNFTNHLLNISQRILKNKNIDVNIIAPLLSETIAKAIALGPNEAQTGPSIRYDDSTMIKHIKMLKELDPELAKIYKELSLSIQSTSKLMK